MVHNIIQAPARLSWPTQLRLLNDVLTYVLSVSFSCHCHLLVTEQPAQIYMKLIIKFNGKLIGNSPWLGRAAFKTLALLHSS